MPIVREFVRGTHKEDSDREGWIMKGMSNFDPLFPERDGSAGVGLAHDVLEHFSATDTSLEAEFLAFGSILYLRGESDYWATTVKPGQGVWSIDPGVNMSGDVAHFLYQSDVDGITLCKPPRNRKLDDELEEILHTLYVHAMRTMTELGDDTQQRWNMRAALKRAIGWMRVGYRKARDRWNMGFDERVHMFECVRTLKMPNVDDWDIEGFKVIVDPSGPRARIEIIERELEEEYY